jgi:5-oxoprolinase (ATP-hydrolysing)
VVVTNHPGFGGSHLPDVTVITPVYELDTGGALLGFVANRAHHAEIGGTRPGSMPPDARSLVEEGVVIPPTHLVRQGEARWDAMAAVLREARHPSRAVEENLADLRAQVAANHRGVTSLRALARAHGRDTVADFMDRLRALATRRMEVALRRRGAGRWQAVERLDDGTPIAVKIDIRTGKSWRAVIDFEGSGTMHPGNLNATVAVTTSAVLYVLRLMVAEDLPLNEGLLEPIELRIPAGSLLAPDFPADPAQAPAVVGGNVETSQRIVDTLIKALGLMAGGQGTMNNLLFGDDSFGYYETLCGGAGAGPGFDGADGVHTHMTNTRITDPEVLEARYPVRLERFALRTGSGGAGRWRGGDGVIRRLRFLRAVRVSLLTQHRKERPFGAEGGEPGQPGRQWVARSDGRIEPLGGIAGVALAAGDALVLETPGGGGWGVPGPRLAGPVPGGPALPKGSHSEDGATDASSRGEAS